MELKIDTSGEMFSKLIGVISAAQLDTIKRVRDDADYLLDEIFKQVQANQPATTTS